MFIDLNLFGTMIKLKAKLLDGVAMSGTKYGELPTRCNKMAARTGDLTYLGMQNLY